MKILYLNTWFDYGSTGEIVSNLFHYSVSFGDDAYVIYGRGAKNKNPKIYRSSSKIECQFWSLSSRFSRDIYGGAWCSTNRVIRRIQAINPDLINVHCTNSYWLNNQKFFCFLAHFNKPVVLTLHAEFQYTGNCTYTLGCTQYEAGCVTCQRCHSITKSCFSDKTKRNFKKMYEGFAEFPTNRLILVPVSPWLEHQVNRSLILGRFQTHTIINGIDTDAFFVNQDIQRSNSTIEILFAVPKLSFERANLKGGDFFYEIAKKTTNLPIHYTVISQFPPSLTKPLPQNCDLIIGANKTRMRLAYNSCDATLLLSQKETFSMVCAESLLCGTPVVGFKAGAPETLFSMFDSLFFDYGDIESIVLALTHLRKRSIEERKSLHDKMALQFSKKRMCEDYECLFSSLLGVKK